MRLPFAFAAALVLSSCATAATPAPAQLTFADGKITWAEGSLSVPVPDGWKAEPVGEMPFAVLVASADRSGSLVAMVVPTEPPDQTLDALLGEVVAGRQAKFPGMHDVAYADRALGKIAGRSATMVIPQGTIEVYVDVVAVHQGPYTVNLTCSSAVGYPEARLACDTLLAKTVLAP